MIMRFIVVPTALLTAAIIAVASMRVVAGSEHWLALAGGGALSVLGWRWMRQRRWLRAFAHELAHAIAAFITRGHVHEFRVSAAAQSYVVHDSSAWRLVSLAPYTVPLGALTMLGAVLMGVPITGRALAMGMGGLLALHSMSAFSDYRACAAAGWRGTDFAHQPRTLAALAAVTNAIVLGALACWATAGSRGVRGLGVGVVELATSVFH